MAWNLAGSYSETCSCELMCPCNTSFDHGATFSQAASLIPHKAGNWGDRDFIAAGRGGTVYVTWDYGPSAEIGRASCRERVFRVV